MAKRTAPAPDLRWVVVKDYYRDGDNMRDEWPFLYGTQAEAEDAKLRLEAGQDQSWFSTDSDEEAFLYVDQIDIAPPARSYGGHQY